MYVISAVALLAVLAVGVNSTIQCYSCSSTWGVYSGGNCNPPDTTTNTLTCNMTCLSTFAPGSTTRGCGDMSQDTCSGVGSLSVCTSHCSTNNCNTKAAPAAAPRSLTTPLFVALVTAAACVLGKIA